jgi:hypothetical protein
LLFGLVILVAIATAMACWVSYRSGFKAGSGDMESYYSPIIEEKIRERDGAYEEANAQARADTLRSVAEALHRLELADAKGLTYDAERVRYLVECELNAAGRDLGEIPKGSQT